MEFGELPRPFRQPSVGLPRSKYGGYRVLAEIDVGRVRLKICNGADATAWFPEITMALAATPGHQLLLDGEVCVVDEFGRCDFERLKRRTQMCATSPARTWSRTAGSTSLWPTTAA